MNTDLIAYYRDRAREYERIYLIPERQADIKQAGMVLQNLFRDKSVFEIACGTGFWTEAIAQTAHSVFATDINATVLDIARQKTYARNNVNFAVENCFHLSTSGTYENLFGGFIWSHIRLEELAGFLSHIHQSVKPGATIAFMDNNYVEGSNHPVSETDNSGNTFQTRKLDDGSTYQILKNFPAESFLRELLAGISTDFNFINFKYFWLVSYRTALNA